MIVLLAMRVPIAVALGGVALAGLYYLLGFQPMVSAAGELTFDFIASWQLSAVPLFIFMGAISSRSGLVSGIYNAARLWLSGLPGGLAISTNFASAGFAASSGSSLATAAAMSKLAIPEMLRAGYQPALASATVAAAGTLGALIPPSILLIIYGLIAQQSVGDLLLAGALPGILTAVLYALLIVIRCSIDNKLAPSLDIKPTFQERLSSLKGVWPLPVLIIAVMGAIYSGIATATEAAALGCLAALFIALIRGRLTVAVIYESVSETLATTGLIFFIVIGAVLFTKFLALSGLPDFVASLAAYGNDSAGLLILIIAVIYLFLGMFLDSLGLMLLTLPIFLPLVESAGFNMIWFGVMVVKFVEVGVITPPVGLNAFVVKGAVGDQIELGDIFRGLGWFIAVEFVIISILYFFPSISLLLPTLAKS